MNIKEMAYMYDEIIWGRDYSDHTAYEINELHDWFVTEIYDDPCSIIGGLACRFERSGDIRCIKLIIQICEYRRSYFKKL